MILLETLQREMGLKSDTNFGKFIFGIKTMQVLPQELGREEVSKKYLIALKR